MSATLQACEFRALCEPDEGYDELDDVPDAEIAEWLCEHEEDAEREHYAGMAPLAVLRDLRDRMDWLQWEHTMDVLRLEVRRREWPRK